eukprot:376826_1
MHTTSDPKIKYFRNGSFIDMSFKQHSAEFHSYREWRQASNYTKTQNSRFVDLISSNNHVFTYAQCIENLHGCLAAHIPPSDILIAILYLSCHHFSPHAMDLMKHLLTNYDNIDLHVTSISSPQFTIPHVAAMNGAADLIQKYYNLNGNINIKDGRGVYPITISIAERQLKTCESLLWMNAMINTDQLSMLDERSNEDVASFIAAFIHFIQVIEWSTRYTHEQLNIPHELRVVVTDYMLPMDAYRGVKELLRKFSYNRGSDWNAIEQIAIQKLNQYDKEIESVASVGIDWERDANCMHKVATNIYVKPTRVKGRVQYRQVNHTHQKVIKLLVCCSAVIVSSAIIWRQYRK